MEEANARKRQSESSEEISSGIKMFKTNDDHEIAEKIRSAEELLEKQSKELIDKENELQSIRLKLELAEKKQQIAVESDQLHTPKSTDESAIQEMMLEPKIENIQSICTNIKEKEQKLELDSSSEPIEADESSTPGPIVPATSDEHATENAEYPMDGKCFVLKHVFNNVLEMKEGERKYSDTEENFGVKWRLRVVRMSEYLTFDLCCHNMPENWLIETESERKFLSISGNEHVVKRRGYFDGDSSSSGYRKFIEWGEIEKNYVKDGKLTAEIHAKITKMSGVYKDNLRCFDDSMKEVSEVVLVVKDQKFYVSKFYLAAHSEYFKALFLGQFQESKKSEIKLTGIDADDFQNYLEVLYGELAIDEYTVEGMLLVADMYDTPIVIRKCEDFLQRKSKKTLKKKLEMSVRFNLKNLEKNCLEQIEIMDDDDLQ